MKFQSQVIESVLKELLNITESSTATSILTLFNKRVFKPSSQILYFRLIIAVILIIYIFYLIRVVKRFSSTLLWWTKPDGNIL